MRKIKYILAVLLAFNILACDTVDFGDTNKNTNGASDPYTAGLLSSAIMSFATTTGRDGLMKPTLYVQYQSQVTYTDEMLYAETPSPWTVYYVSSLSALQKVIDFVSDPANQDDPALISQGSINNQIGVATIMKAIIMKRVTDTYGDVPFSEALLGAENLGPAYDTQENIYKTLISSLKEARDMLEPAGTEPLGDILYDGDVTKWQKLANSVIMQMSLQLSKKYPDPTGYAATEFKSALNDPNGVIETLADEAWFKFANIAGFRNPWNANRTPDYFLSREFTDALNGNAGLNPTSNTTYDERILVYADNAAKPGVPYGHDDGSGAGASSVSNTYYWNNTTPLPLMTSSYVFLNRADAANIGWTTEDVDAMLVAGIEQSYATLEALTDEAGVHVDLDPTAYAAARLADAQGAVGYDQVIGEEKWVSLFGQAFDAWAEWRRTGFPDLAPATDFYNNGQIPRRYLYPIEENTLNGPKYDDGVSRLVPAEDKGTSRVWWDQ